MTAPRLLPAPETVAASILRTLLPDGVTVYDVPTSDVTGRTPFVLTAGTSSGESRHWPLLDAPTIQIDCWDAPTKHDAHTLAEQIRAALFTAQHTPHIVEGVTLASVRLVSYPTELRLQGQPGGVFHYSATYQMIIRPTPRAPVAT